MNENTTRKLQDFDALFTSDRIQILKLLVSYTSGSVHRIIILYIKLLEIRIALQISDLQVNKYFKTEPFDLTSFLAEIDPFCHTADTASLLDLIHILQSYQELNDTMEMFQAMQSTFSSDTADPSGTSGPSSMDINKIDNSKKYNPINDIDDIMNIMQLFMGKESL